MFFGWPFTQIAANPAANPDEAEKLQSKRLLDSNML
jgi:hypothetical protein